jgi:hypothetical protein
VVKQKCEYLEVIICGGYKSRTIINPIMLARDRLPVQQNPYYIEIPDTGSAAYKITDARNWYGVSSGVLIVSMAKTIFEIAFKECGVGRKLGVFQKLLWVQNGVCSKISEVLLKIKQLCYPARYPNRQQRVATEAEKV